jgi:hypothetical protein
VTTTVSARHVRVLLRRHTETKTIIETDSAKAAHGTALHIAKATHSTSDRDLLTLDATVILHRPASSKIVSASKGGHHAAGGNLLLQQLLLLCLQRFDLGLQGDLTIQELVIFQRR